jgi:cytochrome c biogenesis factor
VNITTTDIQLFQILKQKLGEKEAEALVGFVDSKLRENNEANLKILATKEDIAKLKGELETKIAEAKADTIKWMFIFWTGSILTTLGGMFAFLKVFLSK